MEIALDLTNGVCWSLVYILAIILGIRRKTWCIPKMAICQNFAWEFLIVLSQFQSGADWRLGYLIQIVWLILDAVILVLWLWVDRNKLRSNVLLLFAVMLLMYVLGYKLRMWAYMAFLINAIMSALFLIRFIMEPGLWVSIPIAIAKLKGTLAATILDGLMGRNLILLWLGGICLILDVCYVYLIIKEGDQNNREAQ